MVPGHTSDITIPPFLVPRPNNPSPTCRLPPLLIVWEQKEPKTRGCASGFSYGASAAITFVIAALLLLADRNP